MHKEMPSRISGDHQERSEELFLANVSHELRIPVSNIVALTDLIQRSSRPEEVNSYVHMIRESADSLLYILNDIIDYSKLKSGKVELQQNSFSLSEVIASLSTLFELQAASKGLKFSLSVDPEVPDFYQGDAQRIKQILRNLLSNSFKFTEEGEVLLQVSVAGTDEDGIILRISVTDSGIGIPEEKQAGLFQPFFQAHPGAKQSGTGLGLLICRNLVHLMGGEITLESRPGEGSRFSCTIRLKSAGSEGTEDACSVQNIDSGCREEGLDILVAEDDRINRLFLCRILSEAGHRVKTVVSGQETLQVLRQTHFDLILMDGQMPDLDGISTARIIRASRNDLFNADIPIIALTACAMKNDRQRFLDAGMNEYLAKPVHPRLLLSVIDRLAGHDSSSQK